MCKVHLPQATVYREHFLYMTVLIPYLVHIKDLLSDPISLVVFFFYEFKGNNHAMSVLDLPSDILVAEIPKYLLPEDTVKFSTLNKALYAVYYKSPLTTALFKIFYNKKFTNNSQDLELIDNVDRNWVELFQTRVSLKQRVYTWGSNEFGRLGYLINQLPHPEQLTNVDRMSHAGVHTPTNLSNFNGHIITDVIANGFSFIVLTNSGDLFYTGSLWRRTHYACPAPYESRDYHKPLSAFNGGEYVAPRQPLRARVGGIMLPFRRTSRDEGQMGHAGIGGRRRLATHPNLRLPPEQQPPLPEGVESSDPPEPPKKLNIEDSNFITKFKKLGSAPIVSFSAGRQHILALDMDGHLFTWDTGTDETVGVQLEFPGLDMRGIGKICAGWDLSGCYVPAIGLIICYGREALTKDNFELGISNAQYFIVPDTAHCIDDFALGEGFALFIKNGKLYELSDINPRRLAALAASKLPIPYDEIYMNVQQREELNDWLARYNAKTDRQVLFVKVSSCYKSFVVFTDADQVLMGSGQPIDGENRGVYADPIVVPELQGRNIKSVEIGDYHFIALTKDGEVLSWGTESRECGCLGIGSALQYIEHNDSIAVEDLGAGRGIKLNKPAKVVSPGKGRWVSITAKGWHSGGIFIPSEEC